MIWVDFCKVCLYYLNMKINKNIKSVGWFMEEGIVIDDRKGLSEDFVMMFEEGEKVNSFEEGVEKVKEYVFEAFAQTAWYPVYIPFRTINF